MKQLLINIKKTIFSKPYIFFTGLEVFSDSVFDFLRIKPGGRNKNEDCLEALMAWLCHAQDATPDGGVSRAYSVAYHNFFQTKGWQGSYPETTGYIIPTFFDYSHYSQKESYFGRAVQMADWECNLQMENGAVMGGTIDFKPTPAVFNTGQVILGWCRTYRETGDSKYLVAAEKAGDFLVSAQDSDGAWHHEGASQFAAPKISVYNTRCAWALAELDAICKSGKYKSAAIRNVNWAIEEQLENGWFSKNCLSDENRPLVHTIAYAIQGVMETGVALNNEQYIQKAILSAKALAKLLRSDGSLAGRYDKDWQPAAKWSCLTGNAQMSIIWSRLYQLGFGEEFRGAAARINAFTRSLINLRTRSLGRYGGVKGSYPVYGDYGTFEYLNWAAKFTVDALMLEQKTKNDIKIIVAGDQGKQLFACT